jgi:hypothetical protein
VDLSKYSLSSSEAPVTGHELANLKTYMGSDTWKTASTASQSLNIDFGAAVECDSVAFQNSNLHTGNTPTELQYSSDNSTWFTATSVIGSPSPPGSPIFVDFGAQTKRYWRILMTPNANPPELGALFVGKRLDIGIPYDFLANRNNPRFQTSEQTALDGTIRTSQNYPGRGVWSVSFKQPGVSDTVKAAFIAHFTKVGGKLRPFYFIDVDDKIYYVLFDYDQDTSQDFRYNLNLIDKITFKEQLATR